MAVLEAEREQISEPHSGSGWGKLTLLGKFGALGEHQKQRRQLQAGRRRGSRAEARAETQAPQAKAGEGGLQGQGSFAGTLAPLTPRTLSRTWGTGGRIPNKAAGLPPAHHWLLLNTPAPPLPGSGWYINKKSGCGLCTIAFPSPAATLADFLDFLAFPSAPSLAAPALTESRFPPESPNHEGREWKRRRRRPQLRAQGREDVRRRRGSGPLSVGAERRHLPLRRGRHPPSCAVGRAAGERAALRHERLLLAPQGAGAHAPPEPQGQQGGDPAARHRLHLGLAAGVGLSGRREPRGPGPPCPGAPQHAQRRDESCGRACLRWRR